LQAKARSLRKSPINSYVDEITFKTEDVWFEDEEFQLFEDLYSQYSTKFDCTPIMVGNDRKSLVFSLKLKNKNIYKITLTKI
jgi:hypothetical protein